MLFTDYTKQVASKEQEIRTATIVTYFDISIYLMHTKAATNASSLSRDISVHDKENAYYDIELLKRAVDQKKVSIATLSAEIQELEKQRAEIDADANIRESRTSYAISLYSKISNIAWDYTAPAGHLAGCISCDTEKAFKSFDVQIDGMTSFDVANDMWDMIYDAVEA